MVNSRAFLYFSVLQSYRVKLLRMKSLGSLRLQPYDPSELNKITNVEHRFVCCYCIEICFSIEKLKNHYQEVHGLISQPSQPKVCNICLQKFKNSKTLSKHVKSVHYKLKSFNCSVCSKQFSRKATLDVSSSAVISCSSFLIVNIISHQDSSKTTSQ